MVCLTRYKASAGYERTQGLLCGLISQDRCTGSARSGGEVHLFARRDIVKKKVAHMYSHTYSNSMDQSGKIVNPVRGQLNRENEHFPVRVRALEFDRARQVRQSRPGSEPVHLHTQP